MLQLVALCSTTRATEPKEPAMTATTPDGTAASHAPLDPRVTDLRELYVSDIGMRPYPSDVSVTATTLGGLGAYEVRTPAVHDDAVLLWVHGGAYIAGFARAAVPLAAAVGRAAGVPALSLEYRLAPEHPFPAPVEDVLAAYRALLRQGVAADRIVLAGESAGGGLVLAALVALREAGSSLPAGAAVFSPWADLTLSGGSVESKSTEDLILSRASLQPAADWYVGGGDPADPHISAVFSDLTGLPPLFLHVGSHEVLLDDALRLAASAAAADVAVVLEVTAGAMHGSELAEAADPDARASLHAAGAFLRRHLA
jgi:acetyl esterase/lipase